ncbi:tRNA (guanine-N(7)-)-methyltransferase non-catalytic subunit wuho-like [Pollicipes pollicipes]|uniref:tRNA (guanine-N(7)-)-methyltransferase non-catalytic subunit wuho-like n=1 Tax=Pollicipes pollicipes TaxID=41117 RepID=UPI0018851417|nr:tRNA (guanine-N(7)-)-methyltransferase non-catalytic subunit wuho-like [Pollicipes pollicipes]
MASICTGDEEGEEQASGRTLGLCVSTSGRLVAALNDRKAACVWRAADGATVGCWRTARKASCLTFAPDEEALLVADKSGDVYKCQLSSASTKPQLILGHISMVLDMCVTADGRHLVTCDRDEKIRLTCYPNTWTIDAYCLGHSEFVAALCLTSSGLLVSGGGVMMTLFEVMAGLYEVVMRLFEVMAGLYEVVMRLYEVMVGLYEVVMRLVGARLAG